MEDGKDLSARKAAQVTSNWALISLLASLSCNSGRCEGRGGAWKDVGLGGGKSTSRTGGFCDGRSSCA